METYADTLNVDWGSTNSVNQIYLLDTIQRNFHMNFKELLIVKLALQALPNRLDNCLILLIYKQY